MTGQIPWNEDLETLLFDCAIVKGAHICEGKKETQSWSDVNDMFFNQAELQDFRKSHYAPGAFRRLRVKLKMFWRE